MPNVQFNKFWRPWVLDRGSLTQRLIHYSENHFSVRVLQQVTGTPQNSERRTLNLKLRRACLVREVALLCYGLPVVYARSIIPLTTLAGEGKQLAHLGKKPLGEFLFKHHSMSRGALEVAPFSDLLSSDRRAGWARRSVFYLSGRPLLVAEFFLPNLVSDQGISRDIR